MRAGFSVFFQDICPIVKFGQFDNIAMLRLGNAPVTDDRKASFAESYSVSLMSGRQFFYFKQARFVD